MAPSLQISSAPWTTVSWILREKACTRIDLKHNWTQLCYRVFFIYRLFRRESGICNSAQVEGARKKHTGPVWTKLSQRFSRIIKPTSKSSTNWTARGELFFGAARFAEICYNRPDLKAARPFYLSNLTTDKHRKTFSFDKLLQTFNNYHIYQCWSVVNQENSILCPITSNCSGEPSTAHSSSGKVRLPVLLVRD